MKPAPRTGALTGLLVVIAASMLSAGCAAGPQGDASTATTPARVVIGAGTVPAALPYDTDDVPQLHVGISEEGERYRFEAPEAVQSGPVAIEIHNTGTRQHNFVVVQPKPSVTMDQLSDLLSGPAPQAAPTIAQFLGGSAVVPPGDKRSVAMHLEVGEYMLISTHNGTDGRPDTAHGLIRRLVVAPAPEAVARRAKPPHDGAGVTMTDDSFKLPDGFGVSGWYKVTNSGQRPHELAIIKINDGAKP